MTFTGILCFSKCWQIASVQGDACSVRERQSVNVKAISSISLLIHTNTTSSTQNYKLNQQL